MGSPTRSARTRLPGDERRRQLAEAAAYQFHRVGFRRVSMADVAGSVGLTAPAIYRYYRTKQELLAAAISSALDVADAAYEVAADAPLEDLLDSLAAAAVLRRDIWILVQRELRHLDADQRVALEDRFTGFVRRFGQAIQRARPDLSPHDVSLVTTAALAVLASPAVYQRHLPGDRQRRLLAAAAAAVCRASWHPSAHAAPAKEGNAHPGGAAAQPTPVSSRGEELLETSVRLFHEKGYAAVSLDEIGAEVGMAGPSIYYHFATKSDLLVTAFTRATEWLAARRGQGGGPASLDDLVGIYVDLGVRERLLFGVYVREAVNLPPEAGRRIRADLAADVQAWSDALCRERPELSEPERMVLVQAARSIVHDVVRVGRLHDRPEIARELRILLHAALAAKVQPMAPVSQDLDRAGVSAARRCTG
jgi:AcrR family transcriptional regulator